MQPFFSNDHLIAVDKPGGWLSVPSRFGVRDERPCLGKELEKLLDCRLWPVHRLDEEVTGLILFAKTAAAHKEMGRWFEKRLVTKTYEALTEAGAEADPMPQEFLWESQILRGKKRAYESPHGKKAATKARLVGKVPGAAPTSLAWSLEPITGRPHQLRFELARHGFPVLGDALYGSTQPFLPSTIALRCVRIAFPTDAAKTLGLPEALAVPPLAELSR